MCIIDKHYGGHKWNKQSLVGIASKNGIYDLFKCENCGVVGKSFRLDSIELKSVAHKVCKHPSVFDVPKKVKVINCGAHGRIFANLLPNTVHEVVTPPNGYKNDASGVWVMGVGEPVKLLYNEYTKIS